MSPGRELLAAALSVAALVLSTGATAEASPSITARGSTASAAPAQRTIEASATLTAPTTNPTTVAIRKAQSFSFALGATLSATNVKRLAVRDLVVVDGADATAAKVKKLKSRGAIVLGYLSVGTVESWRSWFAQLSDHRLEELGDWDGERYADLSSSDLRDALADAIAPRILEKGFDGLFLDNVDMVETHPAQADGMLDLVQRLSERVHAAGGALMAQNGDQSIVPFLPYLDAWNREDPTGTYDFDSGRYAPTDAVGRRAARTAIKLVKARGLLVTSTDYFASPTSTAAIRAVRIACKAGALPFVGDIDLKTVTAKPPHC